MTASSLPRPTWSLIAHMAAGLFLKCKRKTEVTTQARQASSTRIHCNRWQWPKGKRQGVRGSHSVMSQLENARNNLRSIT